MPFEITFGNLRQDISADFVPTPEVDAEFETYIGGGGIIPTGTKQISVTANGTTTEDVAAYANAQITVAVPVPVLDSLTATDNGTYTPTTGHAYSSVVVAIPSASGVYF